MRQHIIYTLLGICSEQAMDMQQDRLHTEWIMLSALNKTYGTPQWGQGTP